MKKFLKYFGLGLLAIIVVAILGIHIVYHSFSPGDEGVVVDQDNLAYFQDTYDECRSAFLEEAGIALQKHEQGRIFSFRVPSEIDKELYTDFLYIPPVKDSSKLLVISSAVHGVEGYSGSAVQQMFLKELLSEQLLTESGLLMIHAVNPFGFKYDRRVSENNVDMNRGSEVDPALFDVENEGYHALNDMLNPEGEVSEGSMRNQFFYLVAISKMLKESISVLRQAILQGQYETGEGIYFGGMEFEPQIDSLTAMLPAIFEPYEQILAIDLHTGYGARRVLHLFPNPIDDPVIKEKTEAVFEGQEIDWGDSDDFYEISGGFASTYLGKLVPSKEYLYMVFEWGTFDTQKTFGSIKSLQSVINENQGYQYGYKNDKQKEKVKQNFKEMYHSSSEAWQSEVLRSGREMLDLVVETYPELEVQ